MLFENLKMSQHLLHSLVRDEEVELLSVDRD